jgi:flagellar protein FliS
MYLGNLLIYDMSGNFFAAWARTTDDAPNWSVNQALKSGLILPIIKYITVLLRSAPRHVRSCSNLEIHTEVKMFGTMQRGVNAYAKVGLETTVVSATPHKLIVMLFDGALVSVLSALTNMKAGAIAEKGAAISKAIDIINNGLRASLDKNAGGEIAGSLDALYIYMSERLLLANLKNAPEMLEEVHGLLADLRQAWCEIGDKPADPAVEPNGARFPILASA